MPVSLLFISSKNIGTQYLLKTDDEYEGEMP